jgi:Flp pilus assembly protein TadD
MSLDLAPDNAEAWMNMGVALINLGRTDDACHDFKQSLALGNKIGKQKFMPGIPILKNNMLFKETCLF